MAFSQDVREELSKIENKKLCCNKAQCYGILLFSKFFFGKSLVQSENRAVLRWLSQNLAMLCSCIIELEMDKRKKFNLLKLLNKEDYPKIIDFFRQNNKEINKENIQCENCKQAFLKGAFLSCGVILDPKKQYKLEFVMTEKDLADSLYQYIQELNFEKFKITKRKDSYVVYTKDSSQIEDFLTLIGATNASMDLMQEKMYKEIKNHINRQTNFETANIDKTIAASARQIAAIAKIFDEKGQDYLEKDLNTLAVYRLENQEMSLKEIAENLGLTRSSVNHRLNKIINISKEE